MFRYLEKICPFGKRNLRYYWIKNKNKLHSMAQRQGEMNTIQMMICYKYTWLFYMAQTSWNKKYADGLSQNMLMNCSKTTNNSKMYNCAKLRFKSISFNLKIWTISKLACWMISLLMRMVRMKKRKMLFLAGGYFSSLCYWTWPNCSCSHQDLKRRQVFTFPTVSLLSSSVIILT